eukprot:5616458-Pyramimonas_sp.AAC.1
MPGYPPAQAQPMPYGNPYQPVGHGQAPVVAAAQSYGQSAQPSPAQQAKNSNANLPFHQQAKYEI